MEGTQQILITVQQTEAYLGRDVSLAIFSKMFIASVFLPLQINQRMDSGMNRQRSATTTIKFGNVAIANKTRQEFKYIANKGVKMEDNE